MGTRILIAVVGGIRQEITKIISVRGWWERDAVLKTMVRKDLPRKEKFETQRSKEEHSRTWNNLEQNTWKGIHLANLRNGREANTARTV